MAPANLRECEALGEGAQIERAADALARGHAPQTLFDLEPGSRRGVTRPRRHVKTLPRDHGAAGRRALPCSVPSSSRARSRRAEAGSSGSQFCARLPRCAMHSASSAEPSIPVDHRVDRSRLFRRAVERRGGGVGLFRGVFGGHETCILASPPDRTSGATRRAQSSERRNFNRPYPLSSRLGLHVPSPTGELETTSGSRARGFRLCLRVRLRWARKHLGTLIPLGVAGEEGDEADQRGEQPSCGLHRRGFWAHG